MTGEKKYKVLIVEDNPETLNLNKFILEEAGHHVLTARNAGEALTMLDGVCPDGKVCFDYTCSTKCLDAVLLDYDLPDVTGGTLGGWIRNKFQDVGIIIITGYGRLPAIVKLTFQIKATLLTKPCVPEEILAAIDATVEKRRAELSAGKGQTESTVNTNSIRHILRLGNLSPKEVIH